MAEAEAISLETIPIKGLVEEFIEEDLPVGRIVAGAALAHAGGHEAHAAPVGVAVLAVGAEAFAVPELVEDDVLAEEVLGGGVPGGIVPEGLVDHKAVGGGGVVGALPGHAVLCDLDDVCRELDGGEVDGDPAARGLGLVAVEVGEESLVYVVAGRDRWGRRLGGGLVEAVAVAGRRRRGQEERAGHPQAGARGTEEAGRQAGWGL